jgi:hypothetical protein
MALCNEWTEWHLTETGWIKGKNRTTFSDLQKHQAVKGTVLIKKYQEIQTSSFSKVKVTIDDIWDNGDKEIIERLLKRYPFENSL